MLKMIKNLIASLLTVGKHLFKRPVTLEYPEKHKEVFDNFRGKPYVDGCIGCMTCVKVCPSGAIQITKDEFGKLKTFKFDLNKCIFCGNCAYYCPKNAIKMLNEYELASENKGDLELIYNLEVSDERNV